MPLKKGSSKATMQKNIKELVMSKPSAKREKAIETIAKKKGMTEKAAKVKQAVAIAYQMAGKSKKKK